MAKVIMYSANIAASVLGFTGNIDDYNTHDELYDIVEAKCIANDYKGGDVVGAMVKHQCADSYAYYVCVKEKPLTLMHLPLWDAWQVPEVTLRGYKKYDVQVEGNHIKAMAELFGS